MHKATDTNSAVSGSATRERRVPMHSHKCNWLRGQWRIPYKCTPLLAPLPVNCGRGLKEMLPINL